MAFFEISIRSSRGLARVERVDAKRLARLIKGIDSLTKKLEEAEKEADVNKLYNTIKRLCEDYKEELAYLIEMARDIHILQHRAITAMHQLDSKLRELERKGYPKKLAEELRAELDETERTWAQKLRRQRYEARVEAKEAA